MFGFLSKRKVLDTSIKAIDKLFTTKEEKAEYIKKIADSHSDFVKSQLQGSTISSKARRLIAFLVVFMWCYYGILYSILILSGGDEKALKLYKFLSEDLTNVNLMVMAFYFGNYILSRTGLMNIFRKNQK